MVSCKAMMDYCRAFDGDKCAVAWSHNRRFISGILFPERNVMGSIRRFLCVRQHRMQGHNISNGLTATSKGY